MSKLVRRAGRGTDEAGALVVWSVAEGRRGRRWREVRSVAGAVVSSLLLETDPDGRFSHAELGTGAGLLTLHPEGDGTIHGNVVTAAGIEHVRGLSWNPDSVVIVEGSTIAAAAAAAHGLGHVVVAGTSVTRPAVIVDLGLGVRVGDVSIVAVDGDGLPLLADAKTWPLDVE